MWYRFQNSKLHLFVYLKNETFYCFFDHTTWHVGSLPWIEPISSAIEERFTERLRIYCKIFKRSGEAKA